MKKYLMILAWFFLSLAFIRAAHSQGKNDTETNQQLEAVIQQYNQFGDKYQLFETCGRTAVGEPWFARLYRFHTKDNGFDHWEREGYPTLQAAVNAVELAYLMNTKGEPVGYVGYYKGIQSHSK